MKIKNILPAILVFAIFQTSYAQETADGNAKLLNCYYQLKDALVNSDAKSSSGAAQSFLQVLLNDNISSISADLKSKLQKGAQSIAKSDNLEQQRKYFAGLSANMIALAKTVKLSPQPVYEQYCPMQKASWLSNEKEIKNPYYGNAMLTCGSVKSTF